MTAKPCRRGTGDVRYVKMDAALVGPYRYLLTRVWDDTKARVLFVMLNASTADVMNDDPTVRRCVGFASRWGYGGLDVCNLFAFRTMDPRILKVEGYPVGEENDRYIYTAARRAGLVVVAWGAHGKHLCRPEEVAHLLKQAGTVTVHLGLTANGEPRHPLYVRGDVVPEPWLRLSQEQIDKGRELVRQLVEGTGREPGRGKAS